MKFILILFWFGGGQLYGGSDVSIASVEFSDELACRNAALSIKKDFRSVSAYCVPQATKATK